MSHLCKASSQGEASLEKQRIPFNSWWAGLGSVTSCSRACPPRSSTIQLASDRADRFSLEIENLS